MAGKIIINLDNSHHTSIVSELHGQELYEAYVSLTAHIAEQLKNKEDILKVSLQAAKDALALPEN